MSAPGSRAWTGPLLGAVVLGLGLLVAEGVVSLALGRPLLGAERVSEVQPAPRGPKDAERFEAAAANAGIYAAHPDPEVGYVLRGEADLAIFDGLISSDELGMRKRAGPEIPEGALRVVLLGDSVAFGYGVNDDECLAHQLETVLAAARGEEAEPPVICLTVAVPSWNHRAAVRFLLDHEHVLQPDIVLYVPVHNDLADVSSVNAVGARRQAPDLSSPHPLLEVVVSRSVALTDVARAVAEKRGEPLEEVDLGADALTADLTAESRRRYDENAASLVLLSQRLEARGARLVLVHTGNHGYGWILRERLAELLPDLPVMSLLASSTKAFSLGFDPHPNARTLGVWATWLADALLERGMVTRGMGRALPAVPEEYTQRRRAPVHAREVRRRAAAEREKATRRLLPEVDLRTGRGIRQVLGGLNQDGTARMHTAVILAAAGPELHVVCAPLTNRPDLAPLTVTVRLEDQVLGTLQLEGTGLVHGRWPVPESRRGGPLEVHLVPDDWVLVSYQGGWQVASFRPVAVRCVQR